MAASIRFWGYAIYAVLVLGAEAWVFHRAEEESQLKATHPLAKGQFIAAKDVTSVRLRRIVGHDASRKFETNESISADDVVAHNLSPHEASISLVLAADWGTPEKPVEIGDPIKVCLGKETIVEAKAAASTCDDAGCVVTVSMSAVPQSLTNADSIKRLHAEKGDGKDCANKAGGDSDGKDLH
jgi:hypothetical protein